MRKKERLNEEFLTICKWNCINTAKLLIKAGVNINYKSSSHKTALMIACNLQYIDLIKLLISSGCDLNITDKEGYTALKNLCRGDLINLSESKNIKIIDLLIKNGAK